MSRRQPTYGEKMAKWERENDERDWKNRLKKALFLRNPEEIKELVHEGFAEEFSFDSFDDPLVATFLKDLSR